MKLINKIGTQLLLIMVILSGCQIEDQIDPNSPDLTAIENANSAQLNNLVIGSLSQMRMELETYMDGVNVIGREIIRHSGSDPRYISDLIMGNLDNNAFYTTRPYAARYRTVKNLNLLIEAVNNSTKVSEESKPDYLAFAKTIMAHELLMVLNQQQSNGIRLDVNNPDNVGPVVGKEEALNAIANMLNEGYEYMKEDVLDDKGNILDLQISLSDGFSGILFKEFNRALAARVAIYRKEYNQALNYLNDSFFTLETSQGGLADGAYFVFSSGSGDITNPLYLEQNNTGEWRLANPDWVTEADPNDLRLDKVSERKEAFFHKESKLSSSYDIWLYQDQLAPIPIIKNEELILIYAEAKIHLEEYTDAINALNIVRTNAGLEAYNGEETNETLIDEMLTQRRYSLFMEGHRWLDMMRYNKLSELGDNVHTAFPTPLVEIGI
ncbi:RagB/SusD family nutrient uptake outer membrane protein [Xanthovirga aplysinae]|uniref:RagB/SusD family nutrient uptake outer membrane protein n=1 Tax=Xanthovirga aplysinae TaxID=2529853 RepID=UPI001CA397A6|nr:RagB/SusD family nutrient uptake outer membrane protein [Xanthovirga aplysinae]